MPRLAGAGSRCHNTSNTLRNQQQQLADILVQVPPNNNVPCCRVAGGGGCAAWIRFFYALYFSPAQLLSLLVICASGCGVVRRCLTSSFPLAHGIRRLVYCARGVFCGCLLQQRAAVRGTNSKVTCSESEAKNVFGPIRTPENNDFSRPTTPKLRLPGQQIVSPPPPWNSVFGLPNIANSREYIFEPRVVQYNASDRSHNPRLLM